MNPIQHFFAATALATSCLPAMASVNLVTNGSFESFSGSFESYGAAVLNPGDTTLTSWAVFGGDIAVIKAPNNFYLTASHGNQMLDLTGTTDGGGAKGVSQTISGLLAGTSYALRLDLGLRNGYCSLGEDCVGPIELSAKIAGVTQTFTYNSLLPENQWGTFGFTFEADSTSADLTLTGVSGFRYIGLDNVVISAVPEPHTYLSFLLGIPLVICVARRAKRV